MSYLVLDNGIPDFAKAVISLWFRVPMAAIERAHADERPPAADWYFGFERTLPLLMFGTPTTRERRIGVQSNIAVPVGWTPITPLVVMATTSFPLEATDPILPCWIGLDCAASFAPRLIFSFQMSNHAAIEKYDMGFTRFEVYPPNLPPPPDYDTSPGTGWIYGTNTRFVPPPKDWTSVTTTGIRPEFFLVETEHTIEPDQWHHLLLSFDLGQECRTHAHPLTGSESINVGKKYNTTREGTDSACRLWYAIDDVNYNGRENLGPYYVEAEDEMQGFPDHNSESCPGCSGSSSGGEDAKNEILTNNAWDVANARTGYFGNLAFGPAQCSYFPDPIKSSEQPIGLPAITAEVEHIFNVQMAELQIFTGVTLDTGIVSNRRGFVDAEGKPPKPLVAEQLLGKRPDILLHRTTNWRQGKNTGSRGVDPVGNLIPLGQFKRTGVIDPYKPDPSLHGPQGAAQSSPVQLTRRLNADH